MQEIKTFVSLLAFQDIDRKDDLLEYLCNDCKEICAQYLQEFEGKTQEEIHKLSLIELKEDIAKNFLKIYSSFHFSWLEDFFRNESRETISTVLKFVPLEMSGAILGLFSEEERNEILQTIPSSFVSREIMEILKFSIIERYGAIPADADQIIRSDQILKFLMQNDVDLTSFLSFIYSYEIYALLSKTVSADNRAQICSEMSTEKDINAQVEWFNRAHASIDFDYTVFSRACDFRISVNKGYLIIPFIRIFTCLQSKNLIKSAARAISYRMEMSAGNDFLLFCEDNEKTANPVNAEMNSKRLSEIIHSYKLFKSEA